MSTSAAVSDFPWFPTREEDRRFRWILAQSLALSLLLAVILPRIPMPVPESTLENESPPRLVRLLPQPAASRPAPGPKPAETAKEAPPALVRQARPAPGSAAGGTVGSTQPDPGANRMAELDAALSGLRMWDPAAAEKRAGGAVTADEPISVRNPSILTEEVTRGSGGGVPDLSPLAILGEGASLARGSSGEAGGGASGASGRQAGQSGFSGPVRARWEIQEVLDRNKGGIYTLYNRELRINPELNGTMLLTITIDASGRVTRCRVIDSELDSPALERDLLAFIRQIDFGNRPGVPVVTTRIPIEFFPR